MLCKRRGYVFECFSLLDTLLTALSSVQSSSETLRFSPKLELSDIDNCQDGGRWLTQIKFLKQSSKTRLTTWAQSIICLGICLTTVKKCVDTVKKENPKATFHGFCHIFPFPTLAV